MIDLWPPKLVDPSEMASYCRERRRIELIDFARKLRIGTRFQFLHQARVWKRREKTYRNTPFFPRD